MKCGYCGKEIRDASVSFANGECYHALVNENGEHVQDVHDEQNGACWAKSKQGKVRKQ